MIYKFETDDIREAKIMTRSEDMAMFIWELVNNGWREFKHTNYDWEKSWSKIRELMREYNINPDEFA